jgi:hypothetical protein
MGTLRDGRRVELDEDVPLGNARVKVTIEPLGPPPKRDLDEVLDEIHQRLRAAGHRPRTREEIDAYIEAERKSWGG